MSNSDNPYSAASGYSTVSFGNNSQAAGAQVPEQAFGGVSARPADGLVKDTTTAGFSADVIRESRNQPVLVDFWAPWCGPCKQLTPVLERLVAEAAGQVKLVKMNIDDHPSIAGQLGIQSIPAVIAFKNGQPVDGFMGAIPESQVREFIARVGGGGGDPIAEALKAATEARNAGDHQTAADIYSAVLEEDAGHVDALAGLADLSADAGDLEAAADLIARIAPDTKDTPALTAVRGKIALAKQAATLGSAAEFETRIAQNPKDHQARFDLAMVLNGQGDRAAAADQLLAIVRADRAWNDDGARAQLLKFFEAWGPADEATLSARRKLSSVLFS